MKKLITLLLVLTGCVGTVSATEYTVYFKPGSAWGAGGARFALYMYTENSSSAWAGFAPVDGYSGYYKATYNSDYTSGIIIVRFNGSSSENRWNSYDNEGYVWGQSANLAKPDTDVFYDFSSLSEVGSSSATGTMYKLGTWYLAANHHISNGAPSNNDWSSNSNDNKMTATSTAHEFTLSVEGKPIKAGSYGYKFVSSNSQWVGDPENSGNNFNMAIPTDDYYDITYTYNELTHAVTATATRKNQSVNLKYRYYAYYYNSTDPITAVTSMAEDNWSSCEFFDDDNDGTFFFSKASVSLSQGSTYGFRLVEQIYDGESLAKQGSTDQSFFSYLSDGNGGTSGFKTFSVNTNGTYDVIFSYTPTTNNYDLLSTNPSVTKTGGYTLVKSQGETWTAGDDMTLTNGVYSGVISNWANNHFAAIDTRNKGSFPGSWDGVVRPENDASVSFTYATGNTTGTDNSKVWGVANTYSDFIKFSFSPVLNKWIVEPYRTLTIGSAGYTTWSNDEKYKVTGATAYTATEMDTYVRLNEQTAGIVYPAGTALILGGSGAVTISAVASDAETADMTGNNLLGSGNASKAIDEGSYVLYWDGSDPATVGFKKTTAGTLAVHKAYIPAPVTPAPEFLSFSFGETTDLSEKVTVNSEKFLSEESVARNATAPVYNLNGQRVMNPSKGLYIVNGKKVVMK